MKSNRILFVCVIIVLVLFVAKIEWQFGDHRKFQRFDVSRQNIRCFIESPLIFVRWRRFFVMSFLIALFVFVFRLSNIVTLLLLFTFLMIDQYYICNFVYPVYVEKTKQYFLTEHIK